VDEGNAGGDSFIGKMQHLAKHTATYVLTVCCKWVFKITVTPMMHRCDTRHDLSCRASPNELASTTMKPLLT